MLGELLDGLALVGAVAESGGGHAFADAALGDELRFFFLLVGGHHLINRAVAERGEETAREDVGHLIEDDGFLVEPEVFPVGLFSEDGFNIVGGILFLGHWGAFFRFSRCSRGTRFARISRFTRFARFTRFTRGGYSIEIMLPRRSVFRCLQTFWMLYFLSIVVCILFIASNSTLSRMIFATLAGIQ